MSKKSCVDCNQEALEGDNRCDNCLMNLEENNTNEMELEEWK